MNLVISKYGGTTLASPDRIRAIASEVVRRKRDGVDLVVVVSAMGDSTDRLVQLAREVSTDPNRRELDVLLSTGELASMSLMTMAIQEAGGDAVSLSGAQSGLITNDVFSNARILEVRPGRIERELEAGRVVVVAGFQGVSRSGEVTTLGRGASDTTAVALTAALRARCCEIYTDVDGVFTADPRIVDGAELRGFVSHVEMEALAWQGAQVLKAEAVEFARGNGVPVRVAAVGDLEGTLIDSSPEPARVFEPSRPSIAGVTGRKDLLRISFGGENVTPGETERFFEHLRKYDLVFGDLGGSSEQWRLYLSTLEIPEVDVFCRKLEERFRGHGIVSQHYGAVSMVGFGLGSRPVALHEAAMVIRAQGASILESFTSRESLSFVVPLDAVDSLTRALHRSFIEREGELQHETEQRESRPMTSRRSAGMGDSCESESFGAIEARESVVRSYCRTFPAVFSEARGARLRGEDGREYIDFFSGAGALNYGHNNPLLKTRLLEYLEADGITHSLDMATVAKRRFLERLSSLILEPRGFDYRVQFTGPTGTNAVEAALKLARKISGREDVVCFTRAFHGMTLGSLAMTANPHHRGGAGVPLPHAVRIPFDGDEDDSAGAGGGLETLEALLRKAGDGPRRPAAILLETVQAEGGVRAASTDWLRRLAALAKQHGVLLIVDDIQVGCGRTGRFFSFEDVGIYPDIVCLSKSISGFGLPLAIVLLREALDVWKPGEHNGTFRGHNLAFVTGAEALDLYWRGDEFAREVRRKARRVRQRLEDLVAMAPTAREARGRGLIQGIAFEKPEVASAVSRRAFAEGLIVETAGPLDEVLKILPPLVIEDTELDTGLDILFQCIESVTSVVPSAVVSL